MKAAGGDLKAVSAANAGRALALCLVDELVRCGMRHACLSPGSRSTPLALALAERDEVKLHVGIDERSACFFALGLARASRLPVAMVTTSGTAAANCLPAVVEAHHGSVPLVMLTADRPPELRDTGAGQTIDQIKLFGSFVRWFCEVGVAEARQTSVAYWRSISARAFYSAASTHPGPVHLNLAFRDPLTDAPDEHGFAYPLDGRADGRPWRTVVDAPLLPSEEEMDKAAAEIQHCSRGMVVAGTGDYDGAPVARFAEVAGWPLIAEATSNARFGANAISSYDAILRDADFARGHVPDLVLVAGSPGISGALAPLLEGSAVQIRIDPYGLWADAGRSASRFVRAQPGAWFAEAAKRVSSEDGGRWLAGWLQAQEKARSAIGALLDNLEEVSEPGICRDLARLLPDGARLAAASSMPVRDLDWFMEARRDLRIIANRGANGIDGFVSTVLGIAAASDGFTCGLLGDLALLHDQNGLLSAGEVDAALVVINNDGGGIFSFLPQAGDPAHFEKLFGTPHGRDLEKLAAFYGCSYRRLMRPGDLAPALTKARTGGGVHIIEARTDRAANAALHKRIWEAVRVALRAADLDAEKGRAVGDVLTRVYRKGVLEAENFPVSEVSEYLDRDDTVVWVDLFGPSRESLHELADELSLHELAVEDALGAHQRPKLDRYASHLFLSCHAVRVNLDQGALDETEIDAFINKRWLITVRKDEGFEMSSVIERWDRSPDLAVHGVSFLLYGLLDVVVDGFFDSIQDFDEYYEEVSQGIFSERPLDPAEQRHWFDMRRAMVRFHRLVVPLREVVSGLMRREQSAVSEDLYPYFQDVYDHILRVSESSDSLRDLVGTIVETNISLRDYRQNSIVKKVSSWAAIVAVPALITGYYGMNVPYPGSGSTWGVLVSTALMIATCAVLYLIFRRRDWL